MKTRLLSLLLVILASVMPMKLWAAESNAEPYAVLSDNDTKLTFFYDELKDARGGMGVGPFTLFNNNVNSGWNEYRDVITSVEFDDSFANCTTITSTSCWFYRFTNLTSIIGLSNLKTDNVVDMSRMFSRSTSLTSVDLSSFNTENLTDISRIFQKCTGLVSINVSNLNTANVTLINGMFDGCSSLTTVDVSGFDTSKATDMGEMFAGCSKLKTLDLRNFNTANATRMHEMFSGCSSLTSLNVSGFNTANVTDMDLMFGNCSSLTSLDLSSFNTANVTSMSRMFEGNILLTKIYAGEEWNTSKITSEYNGRSVFNYCISLVGGAGTVYDANHTDYTYAHIDGGASNPGYFTDKNAAPVATAEPYAVLSDNNTVLTFYYDTEKEARGGMSVGPFIETYDSGRERWKTDSGWDEKRENITTVVFDDSFANCTTLTSTAYWFYYCNNLTAISGISSLKTDNVTNMNSMFAGCSSLTSIDVTGFNTDKVTDMCNMFGICSSLTVLDVSRFNTSNVTDMSAMFYNCSSLTNLDVANFNTSKVTNMSYMFRSCSGLTGLDLTNFNTANVTEMSGMFYNCSGLTTLDVSGLNTANVTSMGGMFEDCSSLISLDVSHFKTANVTGMSYMFSGCSSLTNLDLSGFNTSNVTSMRNMFIGCSSLTTLDVSGFNTNNIGDMGFMFQNCSNLVTLDLSSFNTANVLNMNGMFSHCLKLKTIYVGNEWSMAKISNTSGEGMFSECVSLVGGAGTTFDANHTDYTYAHIDGGSSNPGYFTDKNAAPVATAEPYAVLSDNNTKLTFFYDDQKDVRGGMSVGPFLSYSERGWHDQRESITNVVFDTSFAECTTLSSTAHWFYGCENLASITGISNLRTDNVTRMRYMFRYCSKLTSLDVSGFKTDNVTDMQAMFSHCSSLTSLDVSGFNTENVTNMMDMFDNCSKLTTIDVSHFNTEKVTNMSVMFQLCTSLTSLDLSNFNTSNVTNTRGMFYGCSNLVNLDIRNFDMSKVNNEENNMFVGCSSLASIIAGNANILAEEYANIGNPNLLVYVNDASLAPQGVQNVVINGLAREIVLTDVQDGNNNFYAPQAFVAERISYTRNFAQSTTKGTSRGWESIALPFRVQTIQHETKGVIAPFNNSASNKHFWLRRLTENGLQPVTGIEANIPYIISMPNSEEYTDDYNLNGRVTFSAQNAQVPATVTNTLALADSSIVMVPAMQRKERSSAVWALNVGEVRGSYFEGSVFERDYREVRPFEAYTVHRLENSQPAPRYIPLMEIGGTTGIETIDHGPLTIDRWYDLEGRKLQGQPKQKGVYISKGKKVVIK